MALLLAVASVRARADEPTPLVPKVIAGGPYLVIEGVLDGPEIDGFIDRSIATLHALTEQHGWKVAGPVSFAGPGWKPGEKNVYKVVQPLVAGQGVTGLPASCKLEEWPAFPCVTMRHHGPLTTMGVAWDQLMAEVGRQGIKTTTAWREQGVHWNGRMAPDNDMELQRGLAAE